MAMAEARPPEEAPRIALSMKQVEVLLKAIEGKEELAEFCLRLEESHQDSIWNDAHILITLGG